MSVLSTKQTGSNRSIGADPDPASFAKSLQASNTLVGVPATASTSTSARLISAKGTRGKRLCRWEPGGRPKHLPAGRHDRVRRVVGEGGEGERRKSNPPATFTIERRVLGGEDYASAAAIPRELEGEALVAGVGAENRGGQEGASKGVIACDHVLVEDAYQQPLLSRIPGRVAELCEGGGRRERRRNYIDPQAARPLLPRLPIPVQGSRLPDKQMECLIPLWVELPVDHAAFGVALPEAEGHVGVACTPDLNRGKAKPIRTPSTSRSCCQGANLTDVSPRSQKGHRIDGKATKRRKLASSWN